MSVTENNKIMLQDKCMYGGAAMPTGDDKGHNENSNNNITINSTAHEIQELRACRVCALIKDFADFLINGCNNCAYLDMRYQITRVMKCTSDTFLKTVRVGGEDSLDQMYEKVVEENINFDKCFKKIEKGDGTFYETCKSNEKRAPGLYADVVFEELPPEIIEEMRALGIEYH